MNILQKGFKYLTDSDYRFMIASQTDKYNDMPDDAYLKRLYKALTGKELNLENPRGINEKYQWLKLYDRKPLYTTLSDKYEAKGYLKQKIGEKYIIPTLGVWERFEEIDFSALPDAFVLKCTHNSGGVVVVRNKNELDKEAARTKIEKCLYKNYYYSGREWPYKDIRPRIIAESLVENGDGSKLLEYKIFCFNGKPEIVLREYGDRDKGETRYSDYFRTNGERLPFVWGYPVSDATLEQEPVIEEILDTARVLSKDLPFVRADFYVKDKQPFIGELTFYHWSGFEKLYPEEWDEKIGEMLDLPEL